MPRYPIDLARQLNDAAATAALNQALYLHRDAPRRYLVSIANASIADADDSAGAGIEISQTANGFASNTPGGALMAGAVGVEDALRRARQWQAASQGAALFAQPDLVGFARIYVVRAAWAALRHALAADPDIAIEPRAGPRRPLQSIILRGWRNVVEQCPDLPNFAVAWQFASVQRAAHEAAADVLRRYDVRCYVRVELD